MKKCIITTSSFNIKDNKFTNVLIDKGWNLILNPFKRKLTEEEILDLIKKEQPYALLAGVEPLTKRVLESAKNLKIISRCGSGIDNIDLDFAKLKNIKVKNTPDVPSQAVAEFTIALLFILCKKIDKMSIDLKINKKWKKMRGINLIGKTLGIIGFGRIGKKVKEIASSIGIKTIIYDPISYPDSLEILKKESDFISIHIPYTKNNHNFINKTFMKEMKKGACLINTSRGNIIDENALYELLLEQHLSCAALDVFAEEPYLNGKLLKLDNLLLTPHSASNTKETRIQMEEKSAKNIVDEFYI
jgi:D-3-phosphoglycerate dehydrogenase